MSSASAAAPVSCLKPHHFSRLITILREANEEYRSIASRVRSSLRPSQYARKYARSLGLRVDIRKAVRCDQKQVSVIPLPILDTSCSPADTTVPKFHSDTNGIAHEIRLIPSQASLKRRPALKCLIPGVVTRTTPNGTTSAIALPSSTSAYSAVSLSSPPISNDIIGSKLVSSHLVSMWSADFEDGDASMDVPIVVTSEDSSTRVWQPLDVPIDEDEMDWGLDDISDMDVSSPESTDSGSDTTSSTDFSAGPATPTDEEPIMIRFKRKSVEVFDDECEKRPRFEQKVLVQPHTQRRNVIRIPARR